MSANDYAYISGRILGYLLFEVLLALCTEGTVSALKHSASAERAALGIAKHLPKGFDHKPLTARILHLYDNALVIIGKSCFVAGTPVRTADGWKPIEAIRKGERVWSRPEGHPTAANRLQVVEDVFQFQATAIRLIVGGMTIETTPQHPFFVADTGWTAATDLKVGMSILTEDGNSVLLEAIDNQEYDAVVYNLRVEEDHTYFVGKPEWGFAVWVHNAYTVRQMADKRWEIVDETINLVRPEIFDEKDYQKAIDLKDKLNRDAAQNGLDIVPDVKGIAPPKRVTHSKHHAGSASPEPPNVQELFEKSIVDKRGIRWAKDENGIIHRFSKPSNGETHWNGSTAGSDGIRLSDIPIEIRRALQ